MPLKVGDTAKLFHKNIHVAARSKHFKELKADEFIVVRVKQIDVRGEGRQKQSLVVEHRESFATTPQLLVFFFKLFIYI